MATIADELNAISVEHGYTGAAPKTIAGAIDALADTLAGTDVEGKRTIAGAVKAIAPYIGSGGGAERVELFEETVTTEVNSYGFNMATLAFSGSITDDTLHVVFDGVEYDLPRLDDGNYGALADGRPDLSTYPLFLGYNSSGHFWTLLTETAGTHTIVAYVEQQATPMSELGRLTEAYMSNTVPVVGEAFVGDNSELRFDINILGQPVAGVAKFAAAGTRVYVGVNPDVENPFYAVTTTSVNSTYTTVRQLDIEYTLGSEGGISFTMPELRTDEFLVIMGAGGGSPK